MTAVFADTFFYLALTVPSDPAHLPAVEFARQFRGRVITTDWVLVEVANAVAAPRSRKIFIDLWRQIGVDRNTAVIRANWSLLERGVQLYESRFDKGWSLTDCISFIVMQDHGIAEALTGDHHFEHAGFQALLK
jgi:predicted nucleic acid-binding protein